MCTSIAYTRKENGMASLHREQKGKGFFSLFLGCASGYKGEVVSTKRMSKWLLAQTFHFGSEVQRW